MIIGLTGYAQSGKDTVAQTLVEKYKYERVAFADAIREILYDMNPNFRDTLLQQAVNNHGWDEVKKDPAVRRMLQNLGVGARKVLGDDVWVVAALRKLDDINQNYVITDVRFENEAVMIKQLKGELWRVKRPGIEAVNNHISEHEMDGYKVDRILHNGGTLEELELLVTTRMGSLINAN
jgi:tRNA uridine 5-carbamoylmethylation protein Kti12